MIQEAHLRSETAYYSCNICSLKLTYNLLFYLIFLCFAHYISNQYQPLWTQKQIVFLIEEKEIPLAKKSLILCSLGVLFAVLM